MSRRRAILAGGVFALLLAGCISPGATPESQESSEDSATVPLPNLSPNPTSSPASSRTNTASATPTPTDWTVPPSQPIIYILWYETGFDPVPSSSPGPHCPKTDGWVYEDRVEIDQWLFHDFRYEEALLFQVEKLAPDFDWNSAFRATVSTFPTYHESGHPDDRAAVLIDRNETTGLLWVDGEEVKLPHRWNKDSPNGRSQFEGNLTLGPERSDVLRPIPGCS